MMKQTSGAALPLAIAGASLLAIAGLVSIFTDDTVEWSWGAMILASSIGLLALLLAAAVALRQRGRPRP